MERQPRRTSRRTATKDAPATAAKTAPVRTCAGCRSQRPQTELMRVVLDPDGVTIRLDYLSKLPGRGAYICPNPSCVDQAVKRGGLKRAFRKPVTANVEGLLNDAAEAARRQLRALLSLTNRAGKLVAGNSRVEGILRRGEGTLMLLARDASAGVQQKFRQWAQRNGLTVEVTLSKDDLGAAVGLPETSLIVIVDPGFAQKIEQEVHRAGQLAPAAGSNPAA